MQLATSTNRQSGDDADLYRFAARMCGEWDAALTFGLYREYYARERAKAVAKGHWPRLLAEVA